METKIKNFKEVYEHINSVICDVFEYIVKKHRYKLHELYMPRFKNWIFWDDINIQYYVSQDPDFFGVCSIPLEVIVNNTWKEYIDSGKWLKEHCEARTEACKYWGDED